MEWTRGRRRTIGTVGAMALLVALMAGCAGPAPKTVPTTATEDDPGAYWRELPPPDGEWRPHLLTRCAEVKPALSRGAARALSVCEELFKHGEGADGITELEIFRRAHREDGLVQLTLAQLYVMAGQGRPDLLPHEGPAADVGDWGRNKQRLLDRAILMLAEAERLRPDDGAVDFLRADVARARGDLEAAQEAQEAGLSKCTLPQSFRILQAYQDLMEHPARLERGVAPDYPEAALREGVSGEVLLDLLLSPAGRVVQVIPVASPSEELTVAAAEALERTRFLPARIGKYPVWSWLRVPTRFTLAD